MDRMCSKVIVVYVDDETQTSRLLKRDGSGIFCQLVHHISPRTGTYFLPRDENLSLVILF